MASKRPRARSASARTMGAAAAAAAGRNVGQSAPSASDEADGIEPRAAALDFDEEDSDDNVPIDGEGRSRDGGGNAADGHADSDHIHESATDDDVYDSADDEPATRDSLSPSGRLPTSKLTSRSHSASDRGDGAPATENEEEERSSSEEERNTVGGVPMRWYEHYDHIGYDRRGQRIARRPRPTILEEMLDASAWRKVYDEKNDEVLELNDEELAIVANMHAGRTARGTTGGETDEVIAWTGDPVKVLPYPTRNRSKRGFVPSKGEAAKVIRIVRAIRNGWITKGRSTSGGREHPYDYDVWLRKGAEGDEEDDAAALSHAQRARQMLRVDAPQPPPPGHEESYNPPEEYLLTKEELEAMDDEQRARTFVPQRFSALRRVPLYAKFLRERFERCLDLYLAVRVRREKFDLKAEQLLPTLPSPAELRPFPDALSAVEKLQRRALCLSVHPQGHLLLVGCVQGVVQLWDVVRMRRVYSWRLGSGREEGAITSVEWCPRASTLAFAVSVERKAVVLRADVKGVGTERHREETDELLRAVAGADDAAEAEEDTASRVDVEEEVENGELAARENGDGSGSDDHEQDVKDANEKDGLTSKATARWFSRRDGGLEIVHVRPVKFVTWHNRGEYLAVVAGDTTGTTVALHRLRQRRTLVPFRKRTSRVQVVRFHPTRPMFFVATRRMVRVYNLVRQRLIKKLLPDAHWISCMSIHPSGDHVLVGSFDRRVFWFDLDMGSEPYRTLYNHSKAVRAVHAHPRLPLFADAADDGAVHVFHATVYDDLIKNPLIVPLRVLKRTHDEVDHLSVLDLAWHPHQPWLFTCGADSTLRVFTNVD